ncbi:uncharacterized protein LOC125446324 [Stegostoma tigrinum]|uniref:uncharacterized protein LOC125446324 n=1 Tax=Stegostoma tigrinum TaxID=3053191 RepID=UPI0028700E8C|nr:uncharacterized protein LOC125446324 [Stegostoma tigrinum]
MQRMFRWKGLQCLLLIFLWNRWTLADNFQISCTQYPVVVEVGATAVLECQLIPRLSLKGLEIRWSKDNALVHLYRFGQDENAGQDARYKDRTQLFASEFQNGNVSLKLMQVTLLDNGKYKCFVELEAHGFRDAEVILNVARFGEWPLINLNKYTGNGIQLQCESENWFPPPTVQWSNEKGVIQTQQGQPVPKELRSVNVKSYIDVTSDSGNTFNCLLKSEMLNKTVSAEFYVPDEFHPKTSVWLYIFLLIFFGILGLIIGLFLFFRKQKRHIRDLKKRPTTTDYSWKKSNNVELRQVMDSLWEQLGKIRPLPQLAIQRMTDAADCIELDCDTANPNLLISSDLTTMSCTAEGKFLADSSARFEHRLVTLGKTGFTSGRHYWLVEVDMHSVWDLGVARESVSREGNLPLIPENGYWTIRHDGKKYWANLTSPLEIMCKEKLQRIGIYVNYNAGQVLFCDGATYSHLHSFTSSFEGMIYPFFSLSGSGKCSILPSITPLLTCSDILYIIESCIMKESLSIFNVAIMNYELIMFGLKRTKCDLLCVSHSHADNRKVDCVVDEMVQETFLDLFSFSSLLYFYVNFPSFAYFALKLLLPSNLSSLLGFLSLSISTKPSPTALSVKMKVLPRSDLLSLGSASQRMFKSGTTEYFAGPRLGPSIFCSKVKKSVASKRERKAIDAAAGLARTGFGASLKVFGSMEHGALCLILLLRIHSALADVFRVTGPEAPVIATVGGVAVLECQLIPDKPSVGMEIQWVRSDSEQHTPIHSYIVGNGKEEQPAPAYHGRTEFYKEEINQGNISLRLRDVQLEDEGDYLCMVEFKGFIEQAPLKLKATSLGQRPVIRLDGYQKDGIGLQCASSSWYPLPVMHWEDNGGNNMTEMATVTSTKNADGLYRVSSSIKVTAGSSDTFRCLVKSTILRRSQQSCLRIPDEFFPRMSRFFTAFILFLILLFGLLAAAGYYQYKQQKHIKELNERPTIKEYVELCNQSNDLENNIESATANLDLEKRLCQTAAERVIAAAVPVTYDPETANPYLIISEDQLTVTFSENWQDLPESPKRFISQLFVTAKEGYKSGSQYWEVLVGNKPDWDLGVVKGSVSRKDWITLSPENGYWTIGKRGDAYETHEAEPVKLEYRRIASKIGIYLNYKEGTVHFYDADCMVQICSFTAEFTEEIYPFFSPWGSQQGMTICPL